MPGQTTLQQSKSLTRFQAALHSSARPAQTGPATTLPAPSLATAPAGTSAGCRAEYYDRRNSAGHARVNYQHRNCLFAKRQHPGQQHGHGNDYSCSSQQRTSSRQSIGYNQRGHCQDNHTAARPMSTGTHKRSRSSPDPLTAASVQSEHRHVRAPHPRLAPQMSFTHLTLITTVPIHSRSRQTTGPWTQIPRPFPLL